jgi:hypothetical protein
MAGEPRGERGRTRSTVVREGGRWAVAVAVVEVVVVAVRGVRGFELK